MTLAEFDSIAPYARLYRWADSVTEKDYIKPAEFGKNLHREIQELEPIVVEILDGGKERESNYTGIAAIKIKFEGE